MKLLAVIPVYNEANAIEKIISDLKKISIDTLVVDDGSADGSSEIAKKNGARVISNGKNCGKGYSLRKGIDYALSNNYDAIVIMDGDGQHKASDVPNFLSKDLEKYDLIIGNRMHSTKNMPLIRIITNRFMSWLISKISGEDIRDSQCGFRLLRKNVMEKLKLNSDRFEIESEVLLKSAKLGFRIGNAPIQTIYGDERSKINPVKDTIRFFKFLFKFLAEK